MPELIFVFDEETLPPVQGGIVKGQLADYLRKNAGALSQRVLFYSISHAGVFASAKPWLDGNLAAAELENRSEPRLVSRGPESLSTLLMNRKGPHAFNEVGTLGLIAIDQRSIPGRKTLVWFGDASSPIANDRCTKNLAAELSTWLREARITVNVLSMVPDAGRFATDQDFIAADLQLRATRHANVAISAVAAHTGGLVYSSWDEIKWDLDRSADGALRNYSLTFDPPRTEQSDEYHHLAVALSGQHLKARTAAGYYNQPVYWDHPRPNLEHVTVAELDALIRRKPHDPDLLRRLDNMRLTERLLGDRRNQLLSLLRNDRERQSLMVLADSSEFAALPPGENPVDPPPGHDAFQSIVSRAFDYVAKSTHKLPDFFATRTEIEYQEPRLRDKDSCPVSSTEQALRIASTYSGTVRYRNGAEVVDDEKSSRKRLINVREHALNTRGTFGPALASVLSAASNPLSSITWSRWEKSERGNLAVFHFEIPSTVPVFEVTYCCLPVGNGTTLYRNKAAYRGEFAVDPSTGAILRLILKADLDEDRDPRAPLVSSQLMIEYAPVEIGGKQYVSPIRSISVSRGRTLKLEYRYGTTFLNYGPYETLVNEFTFTDYHKFGSESRILAGYDEVAPATTPEAKRPVDTSKPN